jgi:hypothetical protein
MWFALNPLDKGIFVFVPVAAAFAALRDLEP